MWAAIEGGMASFIDHYGLLGTFILSAIEAIFFPVPPDVFLPALAGRHGVLWVSLVATVGSLAGAVVGYGLGYWGGNPLARRLFGQERVEKVHGYFERWGVWAVVVAAVTPIPFKVFTIAGGIARMSFFPFVVACFLGRLPRYYAVSLVGKGLWEAFLGLFH